MLRIRDAAEFCGVHPNTLRSWNVQCSVTKGKHRLYTERDLYKVMHRKYVKSGSKYDLDNDTDDLPKTRGKFIYCRVSSSSQ